MKSVLVFLSTYNGEKYITQQLDSLFSQEGVDLHVAVRDDGSHDGTLSILHAYAAKHPNMRVSQGENLGYAESFWKLFELPNAYDYYAFCDQDDVWLPDKLSSAVALLSGHTGPALYTSDVIPTDGEGNRTGEGLFFPHPEVESFYESLQRSILPGCTFVFNSAAFAVLSRYHGYKESHDWAVYSIVSAFGTVLFDPIPHILYRLHQNNTLGKSGKMAYLRKKLKLFFGSPKRVRSRFAKDFYTCYSEDLPDDYKTAAYHMGFYLRRRSMLWKDRRFHGKMFKIYAMLGKI